MKAYIPLALLTFSACSSSAPSVMPLTDHYDPGAANILIWNGTSEAYRWTDGAWVRDAAYDYRFDVVQERGQDAWSSVKHLHRLHPQYDGRAGDRDQSMYFALHFTPGAAGQVQSTITSSLGKGSGTSDNEFREQVLVIDLANASSFQPYDRIRITQHYRYEQGLLQETVELVKVQKDGSEAPFMKNEETAWFHIRGTMDHAPTSFTRH